MAEEKGSDELLKEKEGEDAFDAEAADIAAANRLAMREEQQVAVSDPLDDGDEADIPDVDPPDDEAHPEFDPTPPTTEG